MDPKFQYNSDFHFSKDFFCSFHADFEKNDIKIKFSENCCLKLKFIKLIYFQTSVDIALRAEWDREP